MGRKESNKTRAFAAHTLKVLETSGLQIRVCIENLFSLFLIKDVCCGYSKETSQGDGSFETSKHMFKLMGKKIIKILQESNFPRLKLLPTTLYYTSSPQDSCECVFKL